MSAQGVFTRRKRVTLVKGWLTGGSDPGAGYFECGSGTAFPLKITPSQLPLLAEMLFRVKDAKFSGSVVSTYTFTEMNFKFSEDAMPSDFYSGTSADVIVQRSYATTDAPPVNLTEERSIWVGPLSTPSVDVGSILPVTQTHGLVTGFTQYCESFSFPLSTFYPYGYTTGYPYQPHRAAAETAFSGYLALVDNMGNGSIFDPANELWLGIGFCCFTSDGIVGDAGAWTQKRGGMEESVSGTLTFAMSGGQTLSCDLYSQCDYSDNVAYITITANEWWPYAKAGGPVWKWDDGTPL